MAVAAGGPGLLTVQEAPPPSSVPSLPRAAVPVSLLQTEAGTDPSGAGGLRDQIARTPGPKGEWWSRRPAGQRTSEGGLDPPGDRGGGW